jgi:hypothetical protein
MIGGPYFKKIGDTYVREEDHPRPGDRADVALTYLGLAEIANLILF